MRRRHLIAAIGTACVGSGLGAGRPSTESEPTARVHHWTDGPGGIEPFSLGDDAPPIDRTEHPTRVECKEAVVDGMHAGAPPDSFQVVLGQGLVRYAEARTIHELPDVIDAARLGAVHPAVRPLVVHGGAPVAVPIAWTNVNRMEVRPDEPLPRAGADFLDAVRTDDLSVVVQSPTDPVVGLWILELCLLGEAGPAGHVDFAAGDITLDVLESACAGAKLLASDDTDSPTCRLLGPFTGTTASDREPRAFPGTASTGLVAAVGWCLPKRARAPAAGVAVLEAAAEPTVQSSLRDGTPRRPAIDPAGAWPPGIGTVARTPERWRPSIAVGCGLDMDARRRVLADEPFGPGNDGPTPENLREAIG